jgi:putative oxidoreductase
MMDLINKYQIAELLLRVFCGVIFLYQGYDKLFKIKISGVTQAFETNAQKNNIPHFLLYSAAVYTSIVEFAGGFLLIVGLFKNISLFLLGVDLIIVAAAFSMVEPVWDMRHVFPRLLMIIALLILPDAWELLSLDRLFGI